ncbi:hypothetical protein RUM43_005630 [Polyplax serrata]|uniref:Uncharacterized protein n=1 Tax=Polyplax serrata TaxID=468196 RepID=A0AAN8P092_POLSC
MAVYRSSVHRERAHLGPVLEGPSSEVRAEKKQNGGAANERTREDEEEEEDEAINVKSQRGTSLLAGPNHSPAMIIYQNGDGANTVYQTKKEVSNHDSDNIRKKK